MFHSNHTYLVLRKAKRLFLILGIFQKSGAQCLLENGSFENFNVCDDKIQNNNVVSWDNAEDSSSQYFYSITSDFFSTCFNPLGNCSFSNCVPENISGVCIPHSGTNYCGIINFTLSSDLDDNQREYLQTSLSSRLIQDKCYKLRLYYKKAFYFNIVSNNISVFFSDTILKTRRQSQSFFDYAFKLTPSIKNTANISNLEDEWILFEGNYYAKGGEKFLIIGNFDTDSNTTFSILNQSNLGISYLYIDDVSLVACEEEIIGSEQLEVCAGDSVQLMKEPLHSHAYCNWYNQRHTPLYSGFAWWFTPTQDTVLYTIRGDSLTTCDLRYDSIIIHLKKCDTIDPPHPDTLLKIALPTAFTPNGDGQNETFYPLATKAIKVTRLAIYNRWGQLVHDVSIPWDGRYRGEPQPEGAYWYVVEIGGELRKGVVTLMR
jgi:gliding motility-associated-like protein